jgi:hypothetical protein
VPEQLQINPTLIGVPVACTEAGVLVDWLPEVGLVAAGLLLELHPAATIDTATATATAPAISRRRDSKSPRRFTETPVFLDQ